MGPDHCPAGCGRVGGRAMLRARIAALAALLAIPSAMAVQAVGLDAAVAPARTVAVETEEATISATVQPTTATPGEPITAWSDAGTRLTVLPAPPVTIRRTPAAPPTTVATSDVAVPVRFRTLPPGASLPSGAH